MFTGTIPDGEILERFASQEAAAALAADEARLVGLADQLAAARAHRGATQARHTEALTAGADASATREAAIGARIDVEALEQAVLDLQARLEAARSELLATARATAVRQADLELARLQAESLRVHGDIHRLSKQLDAAFDTMDDLRRMEIEAAQQRARLDGTIADDPMGWRTRLRIAPGTELEELIDRYLRANVSPAEPDLTRVADPTAIAALAAAITQEA